MKSNTVEVPAAILQEIIDHSRAGKPEEICGVIRGRGLVADAVVRGRNVAQDKVNNYDLDPQTLLLQFEFEESGDEMMGIYHSHPVSPAYPSATDAWNAHYPDCVYFICSLEDDDAPVLRAYRLVPHFVDFDVQSLNHSIDFYETRPGLFAYYLDPGQPVPEPLVDLTADIPAPAYLVYFVEEDDNPVNMNGGEAEIDTRIVRIEELPITVR